MANRAYLGPRLGRRQPPRAQARPMVTPAGLAGVRAWYRADLGYNAGTKVWSDQRSPRYATSGGNPTVTTEASLNGQTVLECAAGGADSFNLNISYGVISNPWCMLGVFRIVSGVSQYNLLFSTDARAQFMLTTTSTAIYGSTLADGQIATSAASDLGTTPHVAMLGSAVNVARLDGVDLTHAAFTGTMSVNSPEGYLGYTVNAHQLAEVIIAQTTDLMALAPYIKSRYGLTL